MGYSIDIVENAMRDGIAYTVNSCDNTYVFFLNTPR